MLIFAAGVYECQSCVCNFSKQPISEYTMITCMRYQLVINQVGCDTLELEFITEKGQVLHLRCGVENIQNCGDVYNVLWANGIFSLTRVFLWLGHNIIHLGT